jgi:hypothetical protein
MAAQGDTRATCYVSASSRQSGIQPANAQASKSVSLIYAYSSASGEQPSFQ